MTDHDPPDEFDRFARSAGEALRRPAPADGVAGVRSLRRRQQVMRGVAGVGAVALIVGIGAVALSGGDRDDQVASEPETTLPGTTNPETMIPETTIPETTIPETTVPETTVPETTVPDTTVPETTVPLAPGISLSAWGDAQRAAGRTDVARLPIEGGDGSFYVARRGSDDVAVAVMLGDGRTAEMPPDRLPGGFEELSPFRLGDLVAVVTLSWGDDTPPSITLLDPSTLTWSDGPALGFAPSDGTEQAWLVDGSVLIGTAVWQEDDAGSTLDPSADRRGVIVRPDLAVEQVASPPDGVQPTWSSVSGHTALTFGHADVGSALAYSPSPQPWSFDVRTNAWTPVPNPDWLACASDSSCDWLQPTEGGTPFLEVGTDTGVAKLLSDGSVGVYDPDGGSWRRLDDPPFELTLPTTAVIGDLVVVAVSSGGSASPEPGTFAVLDVANGFWLTGRVPLADDDQSFWVLRSDDEGVLLTRPSSSRPTAGIDDEHDTVVDADTPTGRRVTNDEAGRWVPLSPFFDLTIDELA